MPVPALVSGHTASISHEIDPDVVQEAGVIEGEKYRPVLGDMCSGAV